MLKFKSFGWRQPRTDVLRHLLSGQEQNYGGVAASGAREVTPNLEECINVANEKWKENTGTVF